MTDEQMRDLVKECGLDWQRGYMPLFDDDPTNRYAVLIEAAIDVERQARIEAEALVFSHEGRIERMETLLRRGLTLMNRWQVFYGDADHCMRNDLPLPPAGQVDWAEDVDAVLGPNMAMSGVRHERD